MILKFILIIFSLLLILNYYKQFVQFFLSSQRYLQLPQTNLGIFKDLVHSFRFTLSTKLMFLPTYYHRNELLWVDGFLFDFLQKKSADIWLRKFVIYTGFIFSERLVFDYVIRIYLDNIIWPLHFLGILESENVLEMLSIFIFFYFSLFSVLGLIFLFL